MANAKKSVKITKVPRMVYDEVPEDIFVLELTSYEARVLSAVLHRIGGSPEGPRGQIENVAEALQLAGVASPGFRTDGLFKRTGSNSIIFESHTEDDFNSFYKS